MVAPRIIAVILLALTAVPSSAEVAYVVIPPDFALTKSEAEISQSFRACDLNPVETCGDTLGFKVWGPIGRKSAIALLRAIGKRDGPISGVASNGTLAKVHWGTAGGMSDEVWELKSGIWTLVWTYQIPI